MVPLQEDIEFLEHYGVKGMHWGVITKGESGGSGRKSNKEESWAHKHRKALIASGVLTVAGLLAAGVLYRKMESGEVTSMITRGEAFLKANWGKPTALWNTSPNLWKKNASLSGTSLSPDDVKKTVVDQVNPNYGSAGTVNNCRRCTFAYEMRRRGYDVKATRTSLHGGQSQSGVSLWNSFAPKGSKVVGESGRQIKEAIDHEGYQAYRHERLTQPFFNFVIRMHGGLGETAIPKVPNRTIEDSIFKALAANPSGARGELATTWPAGDGKHSIAWEIFDGKPVLFDTQLGRMMKTPKELFDSYDVGEVGYTRLDNKNLNDKFISRLIKNV